MNTRRFVPTILALALAATSAVAAPAPPKGAPAGYETKFKAVVEAEKNEEYEKALSLLDEIPVEKHNVYTRLKRATLLVRLGRFLEAEEILSELMKDPKADAIRFTVQGDLDDLRARMPKLTVRLAAKSKADAWVTVDDKPVGPPVTIPLNPGTHVVVAKRGDVEVFRQKVTLQDSQNLEVEIDTSIAPPVGSVSATKTAPPPPATPTTDRGSREWRGLSPTPFFTGGGVLVVGAIASFVMAKSAQSDVEASCAAQKTPKCDTDLAGTPRMRTWETVSWVSGGLALASIGIGIVLTTRSTEPTKTTAVVTPLIGSVMGLSFEGRF